MKKNKIKDKSPQINKTKRQRTWKKLRLGIFSSFSRSNDLLDLLFTTIHQHIPDFFEKLNSVPEFRKKPHYHMGEILMAALGVFMFHMGSRNEMNNCREEKEFVENYLKVFGLNLPHMDTVNTVFQNLNPSHLEKLNEQLTKAMFRKKVFDKFRLFGKYYQVVIDGTGLGTVSEKYVNMELFKTFQNGEKTHFRYVVEAKLVAPNGFAISLASEFVENKEEFVKQDCEQEAAKRLLEKLYRLYPYRKFCIQADALYANGPFLKQVESYDWKCIVTLQEGSLPTVKQQWLEIMTGAKSPEEFHLLQDNENGEMRYNWTNKLEYQGCVIYGITLFDLTDDNPIKFQYITTISSKESNIVALMAAARMRWKIENEGFQTQKIRGYELEHKYSRKSSTASKNYYLVLQIAHMINQLIEYSRAYMNIKEKSTKKHLQKLLAGYMLFENINPGYLKSLLNRKVQFIY